MSSNEDTYSAIFSVLKHPVRRRVLKMLSAEPYTYTEILQALNVETGYLNYHLENMRELVAKDAQGRYSLSVFGEAAVSLLTRVEEPSRRGRPEARVLGFKLTGIRLLTIALIALLAFNAYLFVLYQGLERDRANALGEALIQTKGMLSEANHILNHTLRDGRIDFDVWDIMFRDLTFQLRLYTIISALDPDHDRYWAQVRLAVDDTATLLYQIEQKYAGTSGRYLNLTDAQALALEGLSTELVTIETEAFPQKVTLGPNPEVRVDESNLLIGVQAALAVQAKVQSLRMGFSL